MWCVRYRAWPQVEAQLGPWPGFKLTSMYLFFPPPVSPSNKQMLCGKTAPPAAMLKLHIFHQLSVVFCPKDVLKSAVCSSVLLQTKDEPRCVARNIFPNKNLMV